MARGGPERLKLPMYASGFPDSAPRLRSAHRDDHLKASPPPSATYNGEHDPSYTPYLPPPTPTYRTRPHRWPFNFFWKPRQRTVRAILKYGLPSALLVLLLIFYFYEPHIEIAFYSRDWVNQEIEPIEPLSGCFDPFRVSPKYNLSEALYGRRRTEVQAGMPMRLGLDCYDFAGTIQIHPDDERDRNNGWIPPDARMQFHTYWRADLAPFGSRQEWMIKSFFATQDVTASLLILWSNGDLSENEILKRYLAQYPDAFALRVVDVITLARETALDGSEMLQMKDAKAWIDGDLIRLLLLWTYGGVWVDMDSLLTRDLTPLLEHEFVTQWDCYDKIYQPLNGALMRFRQHSPYLCEAFHIMSTSAPPRIHSTDWGALLYFKLWRRLLAHAVPPFKILPFCFSDGRSCRLDNRLPDPFTPDNRAGKWTMGLGLEEGGGLDDVLGKVFSVHLHNQWEKSFPRGGWVDRLLLRRYDQKLCNMVLRRESGE
ncbi:glycosyltransferase family 32 protein [Tricholoma matsutake]|nr:glycosyltransferase family 32 protein [Tricholoma matsutake 945]